MLAKSSSFSFLTQGCDVTRSKRCLDFLLKYTLKLFKIRPKDREPKAGARVRELEKEVRGFRGMSQG